MAGTLKHEYHIFIRTTPEKLWEALIDPDLTEQYFHGTRMVSERRAGSAYTFELPDGNVALAGDILEFDPPHRLVTTFSVRYDPEAHADRPSRLTWEIQPLGPACHLSLVHDDFDGETRTYLGVNDPAGWTQILSGLKTLLETGQPLVIGEPGGG
jgi:uncharacterized protein YndB with AHSA1/START domain